SAGWHVGDGNLTSLSGNSIVRSRQRYYDRAHLRMDVAEDVRHPRFVETHFSRCARLVKPEVEALSLEQRKHIVEERVAVRKFHHRADGHNEQVGIEAVVVL